MEEAYDVRDNISYDSANLAVGKLCHSTAFPKEETFQNCCNLENVMKFSLTWHLPHMENSLSSRSILVLEEEEKEKN